MIIYKSPSRIAFEILNYSLFTIFCILIIIPFINVISISLSDYDHIVRGEVSLLPKGFNINGYLMIITNAYFIRSIIITAGLTIINTSLIIVNALMAAYALANKHFIGKKLVTYYYLVTMYFGGGLIPTYILIANWLNLSNNLLALILPSITNVFYIIVFRNAIVQLPKDIMDSAEIDGANNFTVLFKIVIPLIIPMIMAFVIFSAVAYWNEWFGSMLYIRDNRNWTLQYRLRNLLINTELADDPNNPLRIRSVLPVHPQNLRMAALMVTILPIVIIYPFLQKYFIHGVIVGAVKG
ncbi:MAG: carbohydrate ABC transporter permease [Firmicutes bacterium]|nr:carbohydrate ABC transporter permease [Bacillota bacterium]